MIELVISKHPRYVQTLCDFFAEAFDAPPRLLAPKARLVEEAAASAIRDGGYKLRYLEALCLWAFTDAYWKNRVNSVQTLAKVLLESRGRQDEIEVDYQKYLEEKALNPPKCEHGMPLTAVCLRCLADKGCKKCGGSGSAVVSVYLTRFRRKYRRQVYCECCKKGTPVEQAAAIEAEENKTDE